MISRRAPTIAATCRQGFRASRRGSAWQIFLQTTGHASRAKAVNLVRFKTRRLFYELHTPTPHGESRGSITVGLQHIRPNDRETHDIVRPIAARVWIINVVAAEIVARCRDAISPGLENLDHFIP